MRTAAVGSAAAGSGDRSPPWFVLEGGRSISHTADVVRVTEDTPRTRELLLRGHVWCVGTLIPLLVKFIPLRALIRLLTPPRCLRLYRKTGEERIVAIVRRRLERPRNMKRRACLREGLMLFHFLRLSGRPAILRFGVYSPGSDPNRLHAHCWVTLDGRALSPPPQEPHADVLTHGSQKEA